jgi:hypothetical protein
MAVFTSSALALRKKLIIAALREAGATGPASAKSLAETDLENPELFREYTEQLVMLNGICKTPDGKYYISEQ